MLDFIKSLFLPPERSSATAKQRLRVVLLSDHLSLAPETVDALKRDLLEVISRYVEIDPEHADVSFEQREREVAMLANIPITGMRDWPKPQAPSVAVPPAVPSAAPATDADSLPLGDAEEVPPADSSPTLPIDALDIPILAESDAAPAADGEEAATPDDVPPASPPAQMPARASYAAMPRRRRRRKKLPDAAVAPRPLPSGG